MNINTVLNNNKSFMELVSKAIFANPFSLEREKLNIEIAGVNKGEQTTKIAALKVQKLVDEIEKKHQISALIQNHKFKELVRRTVLFNFFHRYIDDFDQLILTQCATETSINVKFANDAINYLMNRGFLESEAIHMFALSFQLRRAFYFIDKSLIGESDAMIRFREQLWNNIFTDDLGRYNDYLVGRMEDFSTLILGETGTGKGTAAKAIGCSGYIPFDTNAGCFKENFNKIFLSINLSQFSTSLIESELFGYKKGAFTGANEDFKGVFSMCSSYGSIFLDEIGEISEEIQIKLLKVLQERHFSPVGSREIHTFKGRVIAATNKTDRELRSGSCFRKDFYYRLCSDIILVPSLKERILQNRSELRHLLTFTTKKILGDSSNELVNMIEKVMEKTPGKNYQWPGNVRELEQCVRRILLKKEYIGEIEEKNDNDYFIKQIEKGSLTADQLLGIYCAKLYQNFGNYKDVALKTGLDWRTVKKYIQNYKFKQTQLY